MAVPLKYNVRSLMVRPVTTLMTGGGIALVVVVFVFAMAMVAGLDAAIEDAGSPDNLVVLRRGATTETLIRIACRAGSHPPSKPIIAAKASARPTIVVDALRSL